MTDLGRTCPACVLCDWWSGVALSDTTVSPQRLPGKQLTSQLVNRIPFAYMTGAARVSVLGGWWKGWRGRYVTEWLIVSVSFLGLSSVSAVTLRLPPAVNCSVALSTHLLHVCMWYKCCLSLLLRVHVQWQRSAGVMNECHCMAEEQELHSFLFAASRLNKLHINARWEDLMLVLL